MAPGGDRRSGICDVGDPAGDLVGVAGDRELGGQGSCLDPAIADVVGTAVVDDYPPDVLRAARIMGVHPARLEPHEGPGDCVVCGCAPGDRHVLVSHDAWEDLANPL